MEADEKECPFCAEIIKDKATVCKFCNTDLRNGSAPVEISPKSKVTVILLSFFLGALGVHRYYVGKIGTGILMTLTFGGLGIWSLIDFIVIICGKFTDSKGRLIDK